MWKQPQGLGCTVQILKIDFLDWFNDVLLDLVNASLLNIWNNLITCGLNLEIIWKLLSYHSRRKKNNLEIGGIKKISFYLKAGEASYVGLEYDAFHINYEVAWSFNTMTALGIFFRVAINKFKL